MLRPRGQSQLCFLLVLTHCCTCPAMLEHRMKQAGGCEVTCSRRSTNRVFVNGRQKAGHPERSLLRSTCQLRPQMQKLICTELFKWASTSQICNFYTDVQEYEPAGHSKWEWSFKQERSWQCFETSLVS